VVSSPDNGGGTHDPFFGRRNRDPARAGIERADLKDISIRRKRCREMDMETELVKSFVAVDTRGGQYHVLMYLDIPHAVNVVPRPVPRFQTTDGLALQPLDRQEEMFKIIGSGVLIQRVGPLAP
jgi:hypothetical protein